MSKIYVSSTFEDLKECRNQVKLVLNQMKHQDLAMEYYVAEDQPPLDKCLADVASCDLYIGIFAWKYGSIPEGKDKSFTELEYEKAVETGKTCLIFLLHEEAPWPKTLMDKGDDESKIENLRDKLSNKHTVSFFKSPQELASHVGVAVHNHLLKERVKAPPEKEVTDEGNNIFVWPPAEELTNIPVHIRKVNKVASPKKSVLIINDDNDIHFQGYRSLLAFILAFGNMGYKVRIEESKETLYSTWSSYDIVVWSCGDDYSPANDNKRSQMLIDYVANRGRLIFESGNIAAWNKESGGRSIQRNLSHKFREKVLHTTTDWVYHDVGDLTLKTMHPIAITPNKLPDTIDFSPSNPGDDSGDANAVRTLSNAIGVYNWSHVAYGGNLVKDTVARMSCGLIAYESENGGRIIYYAFDIADVDSPELQQKLIQNSENWLARTSTRLIQ